jgi:hypothetical protein
MPGLRQLGRAQLTEQGKVVRDDPDRGDKAIGDGEDIDRAHLDVTVSRRHRAQRRPVRADMPPAHDESDDNPARGLHGIDDVHAEPVERLLQ